MAEGIKNPVINPTPAGLTPLKKRSTALASSPRPGPAPSAPISPRLAGSRRMNSSICEISRAFDIEYSAQSTFCSIDPPPNEHRLPFRETLVAAASTSLSFAERSSVTRRRTETQLTRTTMHPPPESSQHIVHAHHSHTLSPRPRNTHCPLINGSNFEEPIDATN